MARIKYRDRKIIKQMYDAEESNFTIAVEVGVHPCTIYEELKRGYTGAVDEAGRPVYDPDLAQRTVQEHMRRCGHRKRA